MSRTIASLALGLSAVVLLATGCASVDFGPDAPVPASTVATPSPESTPAHDELVTTTLSVQGEPLPVKAPAKASVREADPMYYS